MKKLSSKSEIQTALTKAYVEGIDLMVWTKSDDETEFFYTQATIKRLELNRELRLNLKKELPLHEGKSFYLAIERDDFVVVSKVREFQKLKLTISLPSMAIGRERRRSPRKNFRIEDKIDVQFQLPASEEFVVAPVLNTSAHGICIAVSKRTLLSILQSKFITVLTSDRIKPGKYHLRSVRIMSNDSMKLEALFSVGLEVELS